MKFIRVSIEKMEKSTDAFTCICLHIYSIRYCWGENLEEDWNGEETLITIISHVFLYDFLIMRIYYHLEIKKTQTTHVTSIKVIINVTLVI